LLLFFKNNFGNTLIPAQIRHLLLKAPLSKNSGIENLMRIKKIASTIIDIRSKDKSLTKKTINFYNKQNLGQYF